ncbi:MAG: hypothetical protein IJW70_06895 [Clostridia bacterium]|nr:hypothetical protein [Clostridia bacterium]
MIEQKSAPKKKQVGSLFFHLFHSFSLWIYTLLCNSLPARLLTSFDVLELRWQVICTKVLGAPDGKLRPKLHAIRLRLARWLENSVLLRILNALVKFFVFCPLNMYGMFFFIYGAVGAAVYFIAERLTVDYAGNIGWGIAGIIIAVFALPLLCSSKPLYRAAFGSRIVGKILRSYLGLEPLQKGREKKERGNTLLVYAALVLGVTFGLLTFFYHPATIPLVVLIVMMALFVLYIPEAGVLLAAATVSIWWITGVPALCALGIAAVTLISFINKLIRGRRTLHVHVMDFVVLLLGALLALHGVFSQGGALSLLYGIGYTVIVAVYFPIVSLMRSAEWLNRCYKLLSISGAVLAVLSVLPLAQILQFLDMVIVRVDFTMFTQAFAYYDAYFGEGALAGGLLLMLLPIMLTGLVGKRSLTGYFWKTLWVMIGILSVFTTMQIGVWAGFGVMILLFFFMYSYKSLSTAMVLAFPAACGAAWYSELYRLLHLDRFEIVHAYLDVIVQYADAACQRKTVASSVLAMSFDHLLGVGFGEHAVQRVFPHYAAPGMESTVDMQNTYLQLLAECGYLILLVLLAALLLFTMCVLTYLRKGSNMTTKSRVVAGFAGIAGVLVMAVTCNFLSSASVFTLAWMIVALTVASIRTQYETLARAVQTHGPTMERTDIAFRTR